MKDILFIVSIDLIATEYVSKHLRCSLERICAMLIRAWPASLLSTGEGLSGERVLRQALLRDYSTGQNPAAHCPE